MRTVRTVSVLVVLAMCALAIATPRPTDAGSAAQIDRDVDAAMVKLNDNADARALFAQAKAVLVFPSIVKAGFLFGAQYGEGALRRANGTVGYYNTVAASYGLQAGVQVFGYALFFMSDSAVQYLADSGGFELGTGPSIVVVDAGAARSLSTTTMKKDIYAVFFDQRGLMAGAGLQGTKISRLDR